MILKLTNVVTVNTDYVTNIIDDGDRIKVFLSNNESILIGGDGYKDAQRQLGHLTSLNKNRMLNETYDLVHCVAQKKIRHQKGK